ncbi:MAG: response regulator [Flavisolibacter sp.]
MSSLPKLLLCIEDDEDDCYWIQEAAKEIDSQLVFVNKKNGSEALSFLTKQKEHHYLPCLILMDINMPVMDGRETLKNLKKDPILCEVPIIVFSTSNSVTDKLFCEKFGVELVTKPQRWEEFRKIIQHVVLSRCA